MWSYDRWRKDPRRYTIYNLTYFFLTCKVFIPETGAAEKIFSPISAERQTDPPQSGKKSPAGPQALYRLILPLRRISWKMEEGKSIPTAIATASSTVFSPWWEKASRSLSMKYSMVW